MLPEALSNGWCSLRPREDRGCLFVEMRFTADGEKIGHRFGRGLMRSVARLTYEELQAARDEAREPQDLQPGHTARLYGAFEALLGARTRRGTLELDIPERRVVLSPEGEVLGVAPRPRLDSHKLIEEFMVAANVCAAEELERLVQPTMYRIHDRPSDQKLEGLRQFLQQFAINMPPGNQLHPRNFSHVLAMVKGAPHERLVNETVLRSQSQAAYAPDNIGHFGLALARYAHFTSPIRRYADLIVHRALVRALGLGEDGLTDGDIAQLRDTAERITYAERRSMAAERDATDRYVAAFLSDRVGAEFAGRITGVTRFGLFIRLDETGADGLIPVSTLGEEYFVHDERLHSLVGERTGARWPLGLRVEVRLREATPVTGGLLFEMLSEPVKGVPGAARPSLGVRRRFKDAGPASRGGPPRKGGPGMARPPAKPGKGKGKKR
jgi:ribonuclease R